MALSWTRSAGSGTIFIAAEQTGRRARGIEIDPGYVDVAIKRWQSFTGKSALLAGTDQTFKEVEEQRAHAGPPEACDRSNGSAVMIGRLRDDAPERA